MESESVQKRKIHNKNPTRLDKADLRWSESKKAKQSWLRKQNLFKIKWLCSWAAKIEWCLKNRYSPPWWRIATTKLETKLASCRFCFVMGIGTSITSPTTTTLRRDGKPLRSWWTCRGWTLLQPGPILQKSNSARGRCHVVRAQGALKTLVKIVFGCFWGSNKSQANTANNQLKVTCSPPKATSSRKQQGKAQAAFLFNCVKTLYCNFDLFPLTYENWTFRAQRRLVPKIGQMSHQNAGIEWTWWSVWNNQMELVINDFRFGVCCNPFEKQKTFGKISMIKFFMWKCMFLSFSDPTKGSPQNWSNVPSKCNTVQSLMVTPLWSWESCSTLMTPDRYRKYLFRTIFI